MTSTTIRRTAMEVSVPRTVGIPPGVVPVVPGDGHESVWDYPRPPRVERVAERVLVVVDGIALADTTRAHRVLETAGPPVYYVPPADVRTDLLEASQHTTICEWKGTASYHSYRSGWRTIPNVGWSYGHPAPGYESIRSHIAFYAGRVDEAWVGHEQASPQPGRFYGGWITSRIVGPFKGEPGSQGW